MSRSSVWVSVLMSFGPVFMVIPHTLTAPSAVGSGLGWVVLLPYMMAIAGAIMLSVGITRLIRVVTDQGRELDTLRAKVARLDPE